MQYLSKKQVARDEDSHEHNLQTVNGCNRIFRGGAWTITVMQLSVDATSVVVYSFSLGN